MADIGLVVVAVRRSHKQITNKKVMRFLQQPAVCKKHDSQLVFSNGRKNVLQTELKKKSIQSEMNQWHGSSLTPIKTTRNTWTTRNEDAIETPYEDHNTEQSMPATDGVTTTYVGRSRKASVERPNSRKTVSSPQQGHRRREEETSHWASGGCRKHSTVSTLAAARSSVKFHQLKKEKQSDYQVTNKAEW